MGLNKEIWLSEIVEKFYPSNALLSYCKNLDAWVDNNALNLQEAGVDPKVYIDNTVWPIPIVSRTDVPHQLPLHRFDTENTFTAMPLRWKNHRRNVKVSSRDTRRRC